MPPRTTAISGTSEWTRKSEVDSPIAVVSAFTIQKNAVTSGTLERVRRLAARVPMRCRRSICGGRDRAAETLSSAPKSQMRGARGPGRGREGDTDLRPTLPVGGADLATVGADHGADDREPETAAAVAAARARAAEALEGARDECRREPGSAVAHQHLDLSVARLQAEGDRTRPVAQGVVDDAADRLIEAQPIGSYLHRRPLDLDCPTFVLGPASEASLDSFQH